MKDLCSELGNAKAIKMDVADKNSVVSCVSGLEAAGEKIDICINNAGIAKLTPIFEEEQNDDFESLIQTNLMGVWYVTKAVANHMKNNNIHGSIINIASIEAPSSEEKFEQYIQRINFDSHLGFFIRQRSDRQLIGVVNINEIVKGVFQSGYLGFYAFKKCSGQGLMSEGLSLVLDVYFKTLNLHRLEANIQPENSKSINLIKRLNFRREGFSPKYLKIDGQWRDHERYAMTLEDYEENINE